MDYYFCSQIVDCIDSDLLSYSLRENIFYMFTLKDSVHLEMFSSKLFLKITFDHKGFGKKNAEKTSFARD